VTTGVIVGLTSGGIVFIDPATGNVQTFLALSLSLLFTGSPTIDAVGRRLFFLDPGGLVSVNLVSGQVQHIVLTANARAIAYDPLSQKLIGVAVFTDQFVLIDPATGASQVMVSFGNAQLVGVRGLIEFAFDPFTRKGAVVTVSQSGGGIVVVNAVTGGIVAIPNSDSLFILGFALPVTSQVPAMPPLVSALLIAAFAMIGVFAVARARF